MTERDIAMVEIWTFRVDPATMPNLAGLDLAGYKVEATDGDVGKIDEATYETCGAYLIVDTGPWIFGKRVMLPAGIVQRIDPEEKKVYVDRTKDEIEDAPELEPDDDGLHRGKLGEYYAGYQSPGGRPAVAADRHVKQG